MKSGSESYKPAEACRIAEVAPYVLRYWETEFPALSEGKEKAGARLYSGRDVKIIARIRELLYDEGFTVAGAKKRLEAEIREGRFDDGDIAQPVSEQKKRMEKASAAPAAPVPSRASAQSSVSEALFLKESDPPASDMPDRKAVIRELKEIAKLLDRSHRA